MLLLRRFAASWLVGFELSVCIMSLAQAPWRRDSRGLRSVVPRTYNHTLKFVLNSLSDICCRSLTVIQNRPKAQSRRWLYKIKLCCRREACCSLASSGPANDSNQTTGTGPTKRALNGGRRGPLKGHGPIMSQSTRFAAARAPRRRVFLSGTVPPHSTPAGSRRGGESRRRRVEGESQPESDQPPRQRKGYL